MPPRAASGYHEMLGYRDALAFSNLHELLAKIHPADLETVEEAFATAQLSQDGMFNMELRMRHLDGHWAWIHSIGKVTERNAAGKAVP